MRPDENRTNGVGGETEQTSKCGREAQEKKILERGRAVSFFVVGQCKWLACAGFPVSVVFFSPLSIRDGFEKKKKGRS